MPSITEASTSFFRKRRQAEVQTVEDQVLQRLPGQPVFSDAHVQFKRKQLVRFSHSFRDSLSL